MYLKRIELQGFKSFADKTVLEFDKNITSIIGPNGSGKSNITDAVRWVLGEQSMKTLRGSRLEDIIFSGTSQRKRMGFTEVSLILDNSTQLINLDYNEITITRRIFRTGNSEYFINLVPCRLKDIQELFYDTGIGRTGYSIISQGKIDEILSTKSEDRRQIFEEASGIMKYKLRKNESERKLDKTEQNLIRIKDILNELELMIGPLEEQAKKAKHFLNLRDSLKELNIDLSVHNINKLRTREEKYENDILLADEKISSLKKEQIEIENRDKLRLENMKSLELKIENYKEEMHILESNLEKVASKISILKEKSQNAKENIIRYKEEINSNQSEQQILGESKEKKKKKIDSLEKQLVHFQTELETFEKEYEELLATLSSDERHIDNMKDSIMDKMDELSDKKSQGYQVTSLIDSIDNRLKDINREVQTQISNKDMLREKENNIRQDLNNKELRMNESLNEQKEISENVSILESDLAKKRNEIDKLNSKLQFESSRLKILQDMESKLEGYNNSVKAILKKSSEEQDFGSGIRGAFAQLITTEKDYSVAIEISLGSILQNIITNNENDAKRAIDYLKRNHIGRASFLPISSIRGQVLSNSIISSLRKEVGFVDVASNLVSFDLEYKEIVNRFLGTTLVVDELNNAIRISKKYKQQYRIVTLDGDILNRGGQMTGGSLKKSASNLLIRSTEIESLESSVKVIEGKMKSLSISFQNDFETIKNLKNDLKIVEETLNNNRIEFVKVQGELKNFEESMNRIDAHVNMLEEEKKQLLEERQEKEKEKDIFESEVSDFSKEIELLKKDVESKTNKKKETQTKKDELHLDITDYKISVNSIKESILNAKENIDTLDKDHLRINEEIDKRKGFISHANNLISTNANEIESLEKQSEEYRQQIIGKQSSISSMLGEKDDLDENIINTKQRLSEIALEIEDCRENKNKTEIKKVKCEGEIESIKNRIWDEYELTYQNCVAISKPVEKVLETQKNIENLKTEIKNLGEVNVSAIEEYQKANERYSFLTNQLADMEKAKEKLKRVIHEMEVIMKKQFLDQFEKINKLFDQVFKDLFLGGSASLELVDKDDILTSGIDINVQPPGKKLQNMMLLSGGEKAFTAIALLFAIIKLKDTPFCILDEIDAALDDSNVVRFAQYLSDLTKRTQFILVTHRKGTMEFSDILYGVTVEEKGVSKIASLNLNQ